MAFKTSAMLAFSLALAYGRDDKDQRDLLRTNVAQEMARYHIPPEAYVVAHASNDHVLVALCDDSSNAVEEAIRSWPSDWEKDPRFLVLLYYHHLDRLNSWRSKSSPSLHVTRVEPGVYSVDIDLHAPSFKHPVESVKHLKEILGHLATGKKSDQRRISALIARDADK